MLGLAMILFALAQQPPSSVPPASWVTIAQGSQSNIDARQEAVVRTAAEWQALWRSHGGRDAVPAVDFATDMVVAVFAGSYSTGGYQLEIVSARREGKELVVEYVERRPAAGAILTQVVTFPFHIARVPRHEGLVTFRRVAQSGGQ